MSRNSNLIINDADYSLAFGEDVTVSNPYNTVFYNIEHRGKVGICEETPHSSLHDHGSFAVNVSIIAVNNYTATDTDMVILCETSTVPAITISLPSVSTCEGRIYIIKKITNDTKTITIDPAGTETIDDMPTYTLSTYNQRVQIVSTSRGWKIIN